MHKVFGELNNKFRSGLCGKLKHDDDNRMAKGNMPNQNDNLIEWMKFNDIFSPSFLRLHTQQIVYLLSQEIQWQNISVKNSLKVFCFVAVQPAK